MTEAAARAAVAEYLAAADARGSYPGLQATVLVVDDRISVDIRAPLDLPLHFPGSTRRTTVHARGAAYVTLVR